MLSVEELLYLKTELQAELSRRSHNWGGVNVGKVNQFADSSYDFNESDKPKHGEDIKAETGKKIIDLLLEINDYGDLKRVKKYDAIPDYFDNELLLNRINELKAESETNISSCNSCCRGACTGFCAGTCTETCSGCSGQCNLMCNDSCSEACAGCGGSCQSSCGGGCSSGCGEGCTSECGNGCTGCTSCIGDCEGCTGSCSGSCNEGCYSSCFECTYACSDGCTANCTRLCGACAYGAGSGTYG